MSEQDGQYEFDGAVSVAGAPQDVLRALVAPDLMARWMVGVASVSPLAGEGGGVGSQVEVVARLDSRYGSAGWRYRGEVTERSATTLVRDYQLSEARAGVIPLRASPARYTRTVRYTLRPNGDRTDVHCTVTTVIPGLARAAARRGAHSEARSLDCSLQQLRGLVEGAANPGLLRRLRASGQSPQPL